MRLELLRLGITLVLCTCAAFLRPVGPAQAQTQPEVHSDPKADLTASIIATGFNDYDNRRHEVTLSGCTLTTYVYEDWDEHPRVLWSSFQIDLRHLVLPKPREDGQRVVWAEKFRNDKGAVILTFSMIEGTSARHEIAMRRNPKGAITPSPRQGIDSYVYRDSTSFFILHEGVDSPEQSESFLSFLEQYRLEYCYPVS